MTGRSVARRTALTAEAAASASIANTMPPRPPPPHDRFSSIPATPGAPSSRRAISASSPAVSPHRLMITGTGHLAQVVA